MAKLNYYNGSRMAKTNARIKIILGPRENGKSFFWKKWLIKECIKKKRKFCYLRRTPDETLNVEVEGYFSDFDVERETQYNEFKVYRSELKLINESEELKIGRVCNLTEWNKYKSNAFKDFYYILFEEFCTDGKYLKEEYTAFMNMISTVLRGRDEAVVICIGNTMTRLCPYFREFGLEGVLSMQAGSIDFYEYTDESSKVKIAVEMTEELKKVNTFYAGKHANLISNKWNVKKEGLRLPFPRSDNRWLRCYEMLLKHELMTYKIELLCFNSQSPLDFEWSGNCVYVYPYHMRRKIQRVLSQEECLDMFTTNCFFDNTAEQLIKRSIKLRKVCFSDSLTATEFYDIMDLYI